MAESIYNPLTPEDRVIEIVRNWSNSEITGDLKARDVASKLLKNFLVKTDDGTYTLRSQMVSDSSETMHTSNGALSEAKQKFVIPADIQGKDEVIILDICTGLGYNAAEALENVLNSANQVTIDLVEISWETLAVSLLIPCPVKSHEILKKAIENYLVNRGYLKFHLEKTNIPSNLEINVHCKDAREVVSNLPKKSYDAIFLDPFSPGKTPELYSVEFLLKIKDLLKYDGIILTYTSAAPVRSALINIGLEVGEGPAMGRVGGTVASFDLKKIPIPLSENDERMIALSDAGIPFRDPGLNNSQEEIFKLRSLERKSARGNYKLPSTVKTPVYLNKDNMEFKDERTKRRVMDHIKKYGLGNLNSSKSKFLVCPQYSKCICHCRQERLNSSTDRIKEMEKRINIIKDYKRFNYD
jgi:tRNA U34 5-methylaminomethyl-2-thiouridine-forming methyltransferase MnmC